MNSIPGVWDVFMQMANLEEEVEDVLQQDVKLQRNSLIPSPLQPSPTDSETQCPCRTPSPTVFVSLCYAKPTSPVSGQLSLHEYRKILSSPHIDTKQSIPPQTLRRKPKAVDLHSLHSPRLPPSLSSSPSPSLSTSSISSVESTRSRTSSLESNSGQFVVPESHIPQHATLTDARDQCYSPEESQFSNRHQFAESSTGERELNAFRFCLRQIFSRFTHSKPVSDSSVYPRPTKKVLRHQGVSFEIIKPPNKSTRLPARSRRSVLGTSDKYSLRAMSYMPSSCGSHASSPLVSPDDGVVRRPTPRIYEDMAAAHASITARMASNSRRGTESPDSNDNRPDYFGLQNQDCVGANPENVPVQAVPLKSARSPDAAILQTPQRQNPAGNAPFRSFSGDSLVVPATPIPKKSPKRIRNLKPSTPKIRKRHQRNRQPGLCFQMRPLFDDIRNRRHTSLHALRGRNRVGKARTVSSKRRRRNNTRHIQIIDGYLYNPSSVFGSESHGSRIDMPNNTLDSDEEYHSADPDGPYRGSVIVHCNQGKLDVLDGHTDNRSGDADEADVVATEPASISGRPSCVRRSEDDVQGAFFFGTASTLASYVQDLGPGSSQTTSTARMSLRTMSSAVLRSQMRLSAVSESASPFEDIPRSNYNVGGPLTSAPLGRHEKPFDTVDGLDCDANDDDWVTVMGSQQFGSTNNGLAETASGSSLADFSTFGSLANYRMPSPGLVQSTASLRRYPHVNTPLQNMSTAPNDLRQAYLASAASGLSNSTSRNSSSNPFRAVPALPASTKRRPAPLKLCSSQYRHPSPLVDHNNPFKATPPALATGSRTLPDRKESKAAAFSPLRNSKSTFNDDTRPESGLHAALEEAERHFRASSPYSTCQDGSPANEENNYAQTDDSYRSNAHGNNPIHQPGPSAQKTSSAPSATNADRRSNQSSVSVNVQPSLSSSRRPSLLRKHNDVLPKSPSQERLIQEQAAVRRRPPGSLYLSIISARGTTISNDRPATGNDAPPSGTAANSTYPFTSHDVEPTSASHTPTEEQTELLSTRVRSDITLASPAQHSSPLRKSVFSFNSIRRESNLRDEAVRERLCQLEPILLSEYRASSPDRRSSRKTRTRPRPAEIPLQDLPLPPLPAIRDSVTSNGTEYRRTLDPSPTRTGSVSLYSPGSWTDSATLIEPGGRPTRSFPSTTRGRTRNAWASHVQPPLQRMRPDPNDFMWTTQEEDLDHQRRMGRQVLFLAALVFPVGWFMIGCIGYQGTGNSLISRWSKRTVTEFHERERATARILLFVLSLLGLVVCVLMAVLLIKFRPGA